MEIIEYSAPGKVILSGEHSVVYLKNAIAMGLDLRTNIKITIDKAQPKENHNNNKEKVVFDVLFKDENITYEFTLKELESLIKIQQKELSFQQFLDLIQENSLITKIETNNNYKQIFAFILYYIFNLVIQEEKDISEQYFSEQLQNITKISLLSTSTLPISKGLGSSASFNVGLSAALYHLSLKIMEKVEKMDIFSQKNQSDLQKKINILSFELEKIYHGTPSGIDNFVATYGGLVLFNKGEANPKQLENISLPYDIYLIDSQVEKNTKKAVSKVREVCENQENLGEIGNQMINTIGLTTDKIVQLIKNYNNKEIDEEKFKYNFQELIRINHSLLRAFSLSNYEIDKISAISSKYGISCKITGAGQGGYCIAFVPKTYSEEDLDIYLSCLIKEGFTFMKANMASSGLVRHSPKL